MIDERLKIHDRHQLEIKLGYALASREKATHYDVEAYFFAPHSLGLNRHSYPKDAFYQDIQAYVRFMTPQRSLADITRGDNNPLLRLNKAAERLLRREPESFGYFERRLKMFCCIVKSALRDHVQPPQGPRPDEALAAAATEFREELMGILIGYRQLLARLESAGLPPESLIPARYGDEYLCLLGEKYTYLLLEKLRLAADRQAQPRAEALLALVKEEICYRRRAGHPLPGAQEDNEELIFHRSVLKKYMASVLFLNTRFTREGRILEQVLLGLAAGAAMVAATAVAVVFSIWYGQLTLPFLTAIVIGYMFKDRIKELLRYRLTESVLGRLYDHKLDFLAPDGAVIGLCKESADHIKEGQLPEDIRRRRQRGHRTEIDNDWVGENIIRYRKQIRIDGHAFPPAYLDAGVEGVNDILRFNVHRLLERMDDPEKSLFVLDEQGYKKIKGQRVYHLNLIIRYRTEGTDDLRRYRLVLTREGIKRIDEVPEAPQP